MTTITALPTPPTRDDPANFKTRADAFLAALPTFATETNTVASEVNTNATTATTQAATATTQANIAIAQATAAANSASAAASVAGATGWVNGGTYALNSAAISQIDFQTYRKITASSVTTIDPKNDPTNWVSLSPSPVGAMAYLYQTAGGF